MSSPNTTHTRRRRFLQSLAAGTAGLTLGGYSESANGLPKNEKLTLGLIGCGGRMRGKLLNGLKEIPGVEIAAVCDGDSGGAVLLQLYDEAGRGVW